MILYYHPGGCSSADRIALIETAFRTNSLKSNGASGLRMGVTS
jgi:hypothetical protein